MKIRITNSDISLEESIIDYEEKKTMKATIRSKKKLDVNVFARDATLLAGYHIPQRYRRTSDEAHEFFCHRYKIMLQGAVPCVTKVKENMIYSGTSSFPECP